jgi:hypothetical protein
LIPTIPPYERLPQRNDNPNHWAAATLQWALREFPILFVGYSMTGALVRRALYRSRIERQTDAKAESPRQLRIAKLRTDLCEKQ